MKKADPDQLGKVKSTRVNQSTWSYLCASFLFYIYKHGSSEGTLVPSWLTSGNGCLI